MEAGDSSPMSIERSKEALTETDYAFKIILVGDTGVGKTCIIKKTEKNEFDDIHTITLGGDFAVLHYWCEHQKIKIQLWDTCGLEKYRSMIPSFFKGANAALAVFDLTRADTFYALNTWVKEARENTSTTTSIYIVGNKSDLGKKAVPDETIADFLATMKLDGYFQTSAKKGDGLEEMFKVILTDLVTKARKESMSQSSSDALRKLTSESSKDTKKKKKCC